MFLRLNHQKLEVYKASRLFVRECYKLAKFLPAEEKFGMISQLKRASLSVHLNIAEGSSRKSEAERKRYFEMSRGSVIEIDAVIELAVDMGYLKEQDVQEFGKSIVFCFKLLSGMIHP